MVSTGVVDTDRLTPTEVAAAVIGGARSADELGADRRCAEQPYQVLIGSGVSTLLPQFLEGVERVAIIHPPSLADTRCRRHRPASISRSPRSRCPTARRARRPTCSTGCWEALAEAGFTRSDAIVGLGGGATTDLAGFVAATWLRGVKYIALPTTLLAMVDAAVGGKTGINLGRGQEPRRRLPRAVHRARRPGLPQTLPASELRSGLAEVLKCGFIADPEILDEFEADADGALEVGNPVQAKLIRRAVAVKAAVVSADLRERTSSGADIGREALNYGHTLAHAIERREHFQWRHGEAVAVGMVFAAELAHRLDLIDADLVARHRHVLELAGLPTSYRPGPLDRPARGDEPGQEEPRLLAAVRAAGRPGTARHPAEPGRGRARRRLPGPEPTERAPMYVPVHFAMTPDQVADVLEAALCRRPGHGRSGRSRPQPSCRCCSMRTRPTQPAAGWVR